MARRRKGSKKRKSSRRRRGVSGLPKDFLTDVGAGAAGALGAAMVAKVNIPFVTDERLKSGIPLAAGALLVWFSAGNAMLKMAGMAMAAVGAANMLKNYVPGLGEICGESYLQGVGGAYADAMNMNGWDENLEGYPAPASNTSFLNGLGDSESEYAKGINQR